MPNFMSRSFPDVRHHPIVSANAQREMPISSRFSLCAHSASSDFRGLPGYQKAIKIPYRDTGVRDAPRMAVHASDRSPYLECTKRRCVSLLRARRHPPGVVGALTGDVFRLKNIGKNLLTRVDHSSTISPVGVGHASLDVLGVGCLRGPVHCCHGRGSGHGR